MKTSLLVLAAGMGSRFGGMKQTEGLGPRGESFLEYSAYDAALAGFDEIVFVVRRAMEEDFRKRILSGLQRLLPCRLAFQEADSLGDLPAPKRSKPWGTGHALLCAEAAISNPFAAINADDWYGRESLGLVHDFLARSGEDYPDFCMAAYRLRNTTSPHGPVARGLCAIDPRGELLSVEEQEGIIEAPGPAFLSRRPGGGEERLDGDAPVSMNLWGFSPRIFDLGKRFFLEFLREQGDSPSAEFYLPALVDAALHRGGARVKALPTEDAWFGLTWREDLEPSRRRIARLVEEGFYPSPLLPKTDREGTEGRARRSIG